MYEHQMIRLSLRCRNHLVRKSVIPVALAANRESSLEIWFLIWTGSSGPPSCPVSEVGLMSQASRWIGSLHVLSGPCCQGPRPWALFTPHFSHNTSPSTHDNGKTTYTQLSGEKNQIQGFRVAEAVAMYLPGAVPCRPVGDHARDLICSGFRVWPYSSLELVGLRGLTSQRRLT
jgi:hypothetical protein